ncbi:MAG TPA: dTDP-4-dehydrorhamnose 3,5-epimerase [Solirubrobacteraceae bacterium]
MRFHETPLRDVWLIEPERISDERGWFARTFDREEFIARGMSCEVVQCNASHNAKRNTLRGMHYQADPYGESKLVRCVRGAIFDVALDLRQDSPSFRAWHGVELSAENGHALYIPAGFAHGFQTLQNDSDVLYQMGNPYVPEAARGVRFDDPAFAIDWPEPREPVVSERDAGYPDFKP